MKPFSYNFFGLTIGPTSPVRLMGVLNLSPESFYKASVVNTQNSIRKRIERFIEEGADILDLGPKSTAPVDIYGKPTFIAPKEEIQRLKIPLDVISEIGAKILISIDTQSSVVAEYGLTHGAHIINDISGFNDSKMVEVISSFDAAAVIMPAKNKPGDVFKLDEIIKSFNNSIEHAENAGVNTKKIIIDPGIGGWIEERTPEDDYTILKQLKVLREREPYPILVAISRKSFIGAVLGAPPENRLYGSLAATAVAVLHGADLIRTHDVHETRDAIRIAEKLRN